MVDVVGTNNPETLNADDGVTNGADNIFGLDADDIIFGLGGSDMLKGGGGADALNGGSGVDTANYTDATGGVTVSLLTGTGASNVASGDTLSGIENLAGGAFGDILVGNNSANVLTGMEGGDSLFGEGGADTLNGGNGNDVLKGGGGADTLNGGSNTDTASYSTSNAAVFVSLLTDVANGGHATGDELNSIENLTGSDFNDLLHGSNGANLLRGLEGHDTLNGFNGADTLQGGSDNDTLKGGGGADLLQGGSGVDTADYNESNAGVNVRLLTGFAAGGHATGDTLSSIENLTGSDFSDQLWGNDGVNFLSGGDGNDLLKGYGGADTLLGGDGVDTIFGLPGADIMNGGDGNDWMYVENGGDTIVEGAGGGTDRVLSSVDYTLGAAAQVEFLLTTDVDGTDAIDLTGNGFDNDIRGNYGVNTLNGKEGNDVLIGRSGDDSYLFDTTLDALANFDEIVNFAPDSDKIVLDSDIFAGIGLGVLAAGRFHVGDVAGDANDRIIHRISTGSLLYDPDGTGPEAQTRFAYVGAGLVLDNEDLLVVA